jgi:hypothetical protein
VSRVFARLVLSANRNRRSLQDLCTVCPCYGDSLHRASQSVGSFFWRGQRRDAVDSATIGADANLVGSTAAILPVENFSPVFAWVLTGQCPLLQKINEIVLDIAG